MNTRKTTFTLIAVAAISGINGAHGANEALQSRMLGHVEKITVVDSILVDKDNFIRNYRLSTAAGRLLSPSQIMESGVRTIAGKGPTIGYTNEFTDYMLWAQPDSTGVSRLAESVRLIDGSWSNPEWLPSILNFDSEDAEDDVEWQIPLSNASYPFMLDDGVTLYYAAEGPESLGGYDIFEAQRDPSDGSYLKPRNIGMPFNSPYDDFMMAVDPVTGTGWWVSDRNLIEDKLTLYVYKFTDNRENVDPEDENLLAFATLSGWQDLQTDEERAEATALKKEIASIKQENQRPYDFTLSLPGGRVYHYYTEFHNSSAASKMRAYIELEKKVTRQRDSLAQLRNQYYLSGKDKRMVSQLTAAERALRSDEARLKASLSEIIRLEL